MEILKGYPNVFFRSDDHLYHQFMIKGMVDNTGALIPGARVPRPRFSTVEEMNETVIERHNERVPKGDLVYNLGDMYLKTTLEKAKEAHRRMNGQTFGFKGNHDDLAIKMAKQDVSYASNHFDIDPDYVAQRMVAEKFFVWYRSLEEITLGKPYFDENHMIVLCHYAMQVWHGSHKGSWHLYGHSHGMLPESHTCPNCHFEQPSPALKFDVGVDCWDFYPVSIEEVKAKMATKIPLWEAYRDTLRGSGRVE